MSYQFTFDWFTHNVKNFLAVKNILTARKHILEIGSFEGRSTVWIAKNMLDDGGQITCIDNWDGGEERKVIGTDGTGKDIDMSIIEARFDHNMDVLKKEEPNKTVRKNKGRSAEELASMIYWPKFALIYVDGCHDSRDCLSDAVMAWELLEKGGVMILDDYGWKDRPVGPAHPKPAIDAFINFYYKELKVLFINYQVALQKTL